MKNKTITVFSTFVLILMIFSTFSAASSFHHSNGSRVMTITDALYTEQVFITASTNQSVLVWGKFMGGSFDISLENQTAFSNLTRVYLAISMQDDFPNYLKRRPLNVPDGITLNIKYSSNITYSQAISSAMYWKQFVEQELGINLFMSYANSLANYYEIVFYAPSFEDIVPERFLDNLIYPSFPGDGLDLLFVRNVILNSPLKAFSWGIESKDEGFSPFREILYVDPTGLKYDATTNSYLFSTTYLFDNMPLAPSATANFSEIRYNVPYSIKIINLNVLTSNPVPRLTGKFDWILKGHWTSVNIPSEGILLNYTLESLTTFPNVQVKTWYNSTLLSNQGILTMNYTITNAGQEDAYNVVLRHSLGSRFNGSYLLDPYGETMRFYELNTNVSIEPAHYSKVTFSYLVDGTISAQKTLAELHGWYLKNGMMFEWNYSAMYFVLLDYMDAFNVRHVFNISTTNGMPNFIYLNLVSLKSDIDAMIANGTAISDILDYAKKKSNEVFESLQLYLLDNLYTPITLFKIIPNDFNLVQKSNSLNEIEWFLEVVIPVLSPGQSLNISWTLENIPSYNNRLAITTMKIVNDDSAINVDNSSYPSFNTTEVSLPDVIHSIFAVSDYDGRPFGDYVAVFGDFPLDAWMGIASSYVYQDSEGNEFFGVSNSVNYQILDDEAQVIASLSINNDTQVFRLGEKVSLNLLIENLGDANAGNLEIYVMHGRLDYSWRIKDTEIVYYTTLDTLDAFGGTWSTNITVKATSYLGIHPYFLLIKYLTDQGQNAVNVTNLLNGETITWTHGGEENVATISSIVLSVMLPPEDRENKAVPAFPQPVITINSSVTPREESGQYLLNITLRNIGEVNTTIDVFQYFNSTMIDVLNVFTNPNITFSTYPVGVDFTSYVFTRIDMPVDDFLNIQFIIEQKLSGAFVVPPVIVVYTFEYENELYIDKDDDSLPELTNQTLSSEIHEAFFGNARLTQEENVTERTWNEYGEGYATIGVVRYSADNEILSPRYISAWQMLFGSLFGVLILSSFKRKRKR